MRRDGQSSRSKGSKFINVVMRFLASLVTRPARRLILISAILFVLAYPPLPFGFLAYVCLVPMIVATTSRGFWVGLRRGYAFGLLTNLFLLYWVGMGVESYILAHNPAVGGGTRFLVGYVVAPLTTVLVVVIQALYTGALFGVWAWLSERGRYWLLGFPFLWVSVEYSKTLTELAFPWVELAYTQSGLTPMIQTASWWGHLGVSFVLAMVNLLFYVAWAEWKRAKALSVVSASTAIAGLILLLLHGLQVDCIPGGDGIEVTLIQPNLSMERKHGEGGVAHTRDRLTDMTREWGGGADLVVFPETALRAGLLDESSGGHWSGLADSLDTNILMGTVESRSRRGRSCDFNSAVQIGADGGYDYVRHKIRLVPFGEKVPYIQHMPFLWDFHLGSSNSCRGDSISVFDASGMRYAVLICFEVAFAELNRRSVENGAGLLVGISNDSWWRGSAMPYQHASIVPLRSVENRRWYAFSSNSGFSFFCDPCGRILDRSELSTRAAFSRTVYRMGRTTFYTRHGSWLPLIAVAFSVLLVLLRLLPYPFRKRAADNRP
ncbi:apolipoprotein N-acyltransferase [Candidatus Fermentibacteria bacterium]|nr:apolipoprotein N-acyltransferase [Candidatus Fermentibacteria bacterium]